jgi:hypothetical protein
MGSFAATKHGIQPLMLARFSEKIFDLMDYQKFSSAVPCLAESAVLEKRKMRLAWRPSRRPKQVSLTTMLNLASKIVLQTKPMPFQGKVAFVHKQTLYPSMFRRL